MHEEDHLSLTDAAKIAPGRPSTNCIWRWCRRGVLARSGERVHLQHVRIGGKVFTKAQWLDDFGRRLADADAEYFRIRDDEALPRRAPSRRQTGLERYQQHRREAVEQMNRELDDAGL